MFLIAVVVVSSKNQMVNQMYSHDFTSFPDLLSEHVVIPAGYETSRGMVVAERNARSVA